VVTATGITRSVAPLSDLRALGAPTIRLALPRGVIVGSVAIVDCIEHGEADMAHRPWALVLAKPKRLAQALQVGGTPQPGLWIPSF
jgi:hypothetical protein